jgi:hypothetical protein
MHKPPNGESSLAVRFAEISEKARGSRNFVWMPRLSRDVGRELCQGHHCRQRRFWPRIAHDLPESGFLRYCRCANEAARAAYSVIRAENLKS